MANPDAENFLQIPGVPNNMMITKSAVSVLLGLVLCGCGSKTVADGSEVPPPDSAVEQSRDERIEMRRQLQEQKVLEQVPQDKTAPVTGEVPDELLDKVMADLKQRTGAGRAEFTVQRAEQVQWNDGSLGCPEQGQAYTQAIVPGFWIVIDYQGSASDYRASERGYFVLCKDTQFAIEQIRDKEKGPQAGAPVQ